jgi:hypothetical protein
LTSKRLTKRCTQSYALSHPSQPNYIQLFSGINQGVTTDNCTSTPFRTANLGASLLQNGYTFAGYSEGLPSIGSTVCTSGLYARRHCPWVDWQGSTANGIPTSSNLRFSDFPTNFSNLPTVSFVIPNLNDDMHNGTDPTTIRNGDTWARTHLDPYVQWAQTHNSMLIVTFDEDNSASGNHIATLFVGPMVAPGQYSQHITHYDILRTVEDLYGLPYAGASATATPITNVWANPWQEQDVGSVGQAGGSLEWNVYNSYFLAGAGSGIADPADSFHYVYQTLQGDGWMQVEVSGLDYTDPGALAGVTIRESLDPASRQATMALRADGGTSFISRSDPGGASTVVSGPYVGTPATVYLERVGDTLNGWITTDFVNYTLVGSATVSMTSTVTIGLAVTSNTPTTVANASLDTLSYNLGGGMAPRPGGGPGAGGHTRTPAPSDELLTRALASRAAPGDVGVTAQPAPNASLPGVSCAPLRLESWSGRSDFQVADLFLFDESGAVRLADHHRLLDRLYQEGDWNESAAPLTGLDPWYS